jgi:hypothetical protein
LNSRRVSYYRTFTNFCITFNFLFDHWVVESWQTSVTIATFGLMVLVIISAPRRPTSS